MTDITSTPLPIKFLRIDDRLIHGQVIVGWLPVLAVSHLVVASEKVAADPLRQEMMSLSVPPGVSLLFIAPGQPPADPIPPDCLVVTGSPKDAWLCLQSGLVPETFNVGGLHARPGKTELLEALHLDQEDREFFARIIDRGLMPVFQPTPQNDPVLMSDIL